MTTAQPLVDFCAFCYAPAKELLNCGQCLKRRYCSKDCQRSDWKEASHKHFCCKAGEIGIDYEVRQAEEHGLGMFACRRFEKDEMIMAERPILKVDDFDLNSLPDLDQVPSSFRLAIGALRPIGGSVQEKFIINGMVSTNSSASVQQTGLFVTMSRANHSCLGNTEYMFLDERRVIILVASRDIQEGEEITFSYQGCEKPKERKEMLLDYYGFVCRCSACTNPDIEAMLLRSMELDRAIMDCARTRGIDQAIRDGADSNF
jgi:hypothetical protein